MDNPNAFTIRMYKHKLKQERIKTKEVFILGAVSLQKYNYANIIHDLQEQFYEAYLNNKLTPVDKTDVQ